MLKKTLYTKNTYFFDLFFFFASAHIQSQLIQYIEHYTVEITNQNSTNHYMSDNRLIGPQLFIQRNIAVTIMLHIDLRPGQAVK